MSYTISYIYHDYMLIPVYEVLIKKHIARHSLAYAVSRAGSRSASRGNKARLGTFSYFS